MLQRLFLGIPRPFEIYSMIPKNLGSHSTSTGKMTRMMSLAMSATKKGMIPAKMVESDASLDAVVVGATLPAWLLPISFGVGATEWYRPIYRLQRNQ